MGLKITVCGTSGPPVTLANDENGDLARSNFTCDEERAIDVQGTLRGEFVQIFDRKNRVKRITFQTQKIHESAIDAVKFCLDHGQSIPVRGLVELKISDGTATFRRWFNNAAVRSVGIPRQRGASTWQTYEIIAGETLTANPNTTP